MYYVEWALPEVDLDIMRPHEDNDDNEAATALMTTDDANELVATPSR